MHAKTHWERSLDRLLRECADDPKLRGQVNHARYFDPQLVYHIVSKILQNRYLLRPDKKYELRRLIQGVIGRAQRIYRAVKLYAVTFMSNHMHMMLQGPGDKCARFIGFVKREVSRRWGARINWPGPMWGKYTHTALPTAEAQVRCYEYILSHGVKEGIVEHPGDWPGVQCATALTTGQPLLGEWLDATKYGKAEFKERRKRKPRQLNKRDFVSEYAVRLDKLPVWEDLSDEAYRTKVRELVDGIVDNGQKARNGHAPSGVKRLFRISPYHRGRYTPPPWFQERRRMLVWDNPNKPECRAYVARYWAFQEAFRQASDQMRNGDVHVEFPRGAFRPGMVQSSGPPLSQAA